MAGGLTALVMTIDIMSAVGFYASADVGLCASGCLLLIISASVCWLIFMVLVPDSLFAVWRELINRKCELIHRKDVATFLVRVA